MRPFAGEHLIFDSFTGALDDIRPAALVRDSYPVAVAARLIHSSNSEGHWNYTTLIRYRHIRALHLNEFYAKCFKAYDDQAPNKWRVDH